MSQFNTLLFDLDGTLLDTLGDLADSVNYVLSRFCFEKRTDEEVKAFIGKGYRHCCAGHFRQTAAGRFAVRLWNTLRNTII
jgi:phosphoglycolate phosphatase-like HAD superfamily hydrolase